MTNRKRAYSILILHLGCTKNRLCILLPPAILWAITIINLYLNALYEVRKLPYLMNIHIVSTIQMVIIFTLITVTEHQWGVLKQE